MLGVHLLEIETGLDTMHVDLYFKSEKMLITEWTDCVAKGNTLTLIGDQHLVWKDFILVGDEKKKKSYCSYPKTVHM